ncbi:MAG: DNA alkylation repair protein [Acidimicrobiales bacterium]
MTAVDVRNTLDGMGSEQTRKTYLRHGVNPPLFGVKWGDMRKLAKSLGTDDELATELWESGEHESRLIALMIADPDQASKRDLQRMAGQIDNYVEIDEFAAFVAKTPHLDALADKWTAAKGEWISACGWTLVAQQALRDNDLTNPYFLERLSEIEAGIDSSPNRTRHTMNGTLIAIGSRNVTLRRRSEAVARRIGAVEVDHGETACVTPDAIPYIDRIWARRS